MAWAIFVGATLTQQSYLLEHHTWLARTDVPIWLAMLIFLGTWLLMLVAMMGPCLIDQFGVVVRASRARGRRAWTIQIPYLAGYTVVWCLFGLIAFWLDVGRLRLTTQWTSLAAHAWIFGVGLIGCAVLYQFTSWKRQATRACGVRCQPAAVAQPGGAWREGWRMGSVSMRSSGALMLIMFGVGMANLPWMIALTLIMTVEHLTPWRLRAIGLAGMSLAVVATLWGIQATTAQAASDGATQQQTIGTTQVMLGVNPAAYGPNIFTVTLTANQVPLTDATVSLDLSMLDMDMGQQTITLTPQQSGAYAAAASLSMLGHWQVVVHAETNSGPITATFVLLVDGGIIN